MSDLSTDLTEIRSAVRECFEANKGPLSMVKTRAWIADKYENRLDPRIVYVQVRGSCHNLEHSYTNKDQKDAPKILHYEKNSRTYQLARMVVEGVSDLNPPPGVLRDSATLVQKRVDEHVSFFLERHLRDFLVQNLNILESGLELYSTQPSSVEFCVEGRFIDILAKDATGTPVVIELKVKKAYDRVIGQALLYRTLIEKKLEVDRVRLILVAARISKELRFATKHIKDLNLFEYKLSMQVSPISNG